MTVNADNITTGPYVGNGLLDTYAYDFKIDDEAEIRVFETTALGVETELTLNVDYTVTGVGVITGGNIVRSAGALPTSYEWYMRSNITPLQETDFESQGGFFPDVHEAAFDKLTRLAQQLKDRVNRSLRLSDSYSGTFDAELPDPEAYQYLRWNAAASTFENAEGTGISATGMPAYSLVELRSALTYVGAVAHLSEGGRAGGFKWDGSDLSTEVTADTQSGIYVTPTSDLTGASGAWVRQFSGEAHIEWFGVIGDGVTDDTVAIAAAIAYSSANQITVKFPAGTFCATSIDFVGYGYATLCGEKNLEYGGTELKTIGAADITGPDGKTIFVRINDEGSTGASTRSVGFSNFRITESSTSTRDRGISATYNPQLELENITTYGFAHAIRIGNSWNSRIDNIHMYRFRASGLSFDEAETYYDAVNGLELLSCHASSDQSPDYNFDLRGGNSVTFLNLTSEGTANSHFLIDSTTRSINIHGIHTEGGVNFIEVDVDRGSPTQNYCDFSIFGGAIFLPTITDSTAKFVKPTGTTLNTGISSLTIHGVRIAKGTTPVDYFDLSRIANLNTTAIFQYTTVTAADSLTWKNVGSGIAGSYMRSQLGHNGLISSAQRYQSAVYNGLVGCTITKTSSSGTNFLAGRGVAVVPFDSLDKVLDIDISIDYTTTPYFARFTGYISSDGVITVPAAIISTGLHAVDVTFAYDTGTGVITATSLSSLGTYHVVCKVSVTR